MPNVITADIETRPYRAYTWQLRDAYIPNEFILDDRSIMAACWKPLGEKAQYVDTCGAENDFMVVKAMWRALDETDIVVTHNGKKFDLPILNARFMHYNMPPPSPYAVVDTYRVVRDKFGLASNKLEWVAEVLSDKRKRLHARYPGNRLWLECLLGNQAAWAEMRRYNIADVAATEAVYLKLRPWITNHPYIGKERGLCGACGSGKLQSRGERRTKSFFIQRLHCQACGNWQDGTKRKTT